MELEQLLLYLTIMDFIEHDKRTRQRRFLQVPVICYPHGSRYDPQDWIFGETVDVGLDGLRIRFRGQCQVEAGTTLDLLILAPSGREDMQTDVPACILARVSWVDKVQPFFGVEYLDAAE